MATFSLVDAIGTPDLAPFIDFIRIGSTPPGTATFTRTSTQFVIRQDNAVATWDGTGFAYNGNTLVSGTITGLSAQTSVNGFSVANLSVSVAQLNSLDATGRLALLFAQDDLILANASSALVLPANTIVGGTGNDSVVGGTGTDTILGNQGNDVLFGNQQNDIVVGGQGNDIVVGGQGSDFLLGNEADDVLFGNEEIDVISGGQGNDTVFGGQGNDTISGDEGNDLLFGNEGADFFGFVPGFGNDQIVGFNVNEGDRLRMAGGIGSLSISQGANGVILDFGTGTIELVGISAEAFNAGFFG